MRGLGPFPVANDERVHIGLIYGFSPDFLSQNCHVVFIYLGPWSGYTLRLCHFETNLPKYWAISPPLKPGGALMTFDDPANAFPPPVLAGAGGSQGIVDIVGDV